MGNAREMLPIRLKQLRLNAEISQADLAKLLDTGPLQVSRYETGRVLPNAEALVRIAETLECTSDYLLGLSDIPQSSSSSRKDYTPEERRIIATLRDRNYSSVLHLIALSMDMDLEMRLFPNQTTGYDAETGARFEGIKSGAMPLRKRSKRMRSRLSDDMEVRNNRDEE